MMVIQQVHDTPTVIGPSAEVFSCVVIVLVLHFCLNIARTKLLLLIRTTICLLKNCCMCINLSVHVCPVVTVCPPSVCHPALATSLQRLSVDKKRHFSVAVCLLQTPAIATFELAIENSNYFLLCQPLVAVTCPLLAADVTRAQHTYPYPYTPRRSRVLADLGCISVCLLNDTTTLGVQSSAISDTWRESVHLCCCTLTHSRGGNTRMGRCTL